MNSPPIIASLTSMRFVAALAVFFGHFALPQTGGAYQSFWQKYLLDGGGAVTFFFVLSGFILTYNYHGKLQRGGNALWEYFIARVARTQPVHVLTLLFAITIPSARPGSWASIQADPIKQVLIGVLHLLTLQGWLPFEDVYFAYYPPGWTLSAEVFFYFCFPLLAYASYKLGWRPKLYASLAVGGWVSMIVMQYYWKHDPLWNWALTIYPLARLSDFVIGVVMALTYLRLMKRRAERGAERRKTVLRFGAFSAIEIGTLVALVAAVLYGPHVHYIYRSGPYYMPFIALLVWVCAWEEGLVGRLLSLRPLMFLGETSYSFYMIHLTLIENYRGRIGVNHPEWMRPEIALPVVLLATILLSSLVLVFFEQPMRGLIRRRYSHRRRPVEPDLAL